MWSKEDGTLGVGVSVAVDPWLSRRGPLTMGTGRRQRNPSFRLQHLERLQAPGDLCRPAGIDETELRADFACEGGAALARTPCHNGLKARLGLGCAQCLENLALRRMVADYTPARSLCSARDVGTGQA